MSESVPFKPAFFHPVEVFLVGTTSQVLEFIRKVEYSFKNNVRECGGYIYRDNQGPALSCGNADRAFLQFEIRAFLGHG